MKKYWGCLTLGLIVLLGMSIGPARAADKPVTIIFENVYSTSHIRLGEKAVIGMYLNEVEKALKGKVAIQKHWAGEPVPTKQTLEALSVGTIDMLAAYPPYFSGKVAIADIAAMPANFHSYDDIYDLWWNSPLGELVDKGYQKRANAKFLFPAIFAPQNFQIAKRSKKIVKFEDFKGMKIRAGGGMPNYTVKAIGGSPVATVGGEYYTAMQKGTVDAGLMGSYSLRTYKIWEVADQVVNPPIFPHCFVGVWMNLDKWNSLSPEVQKVFIDTARMMTARWICYVELDDARVRAEARKNGVKFYTLPPEEAAKMYKAAMPVWDIYLENCKRQGLGKEAIQIKEILDKRFQAYD